jgi:hypothetical protein
MGDQAGRRHQSSVEASCRGAVEVRRRQLAPSDRKRSDGAPDGAIAIVTAGAVTPYATARRLRRLLRLKRW